MKTIKFVKTRVMHYSAASLAVLIVTLPISHIVDAAPMSISQTPLDVTAGVDPNILLTLDDSGSMKSGFMPESIDSTAIRNGPRGASSTVNKIYYNPAITYLPGVNANGASSTTVGGVLGPASFTAARSDGYDDTNTCKDINLSNDYRAIWDNSPCGSDTMANTPSVTPTWSGQAYYYVFDSTNSGCTATSTSNDACYDPVVIRSGQTYTKAATRTDCTGATCSYAEESQNFANWFSYYRSRMLLAKGAAGRAFAGLGGSVRVAYQGINRDTTIPTFTAFNGAARTGFFTWLYGTYGSGGTPLRSAVDRGGIKFQESGNTSPYAEEPGVAGTPEYSCRQNFQIAFTDGFWNGDSTWETGFTAGNADGTATTFPTNSFGITAYDARAPYADTNTASLADVAFYYWVNDLRTDVGMDNNVPKFIHDKTDYDGDGDRDNDDLFWNPKNDPATWQHMTTYTVGLAGEGVNPFTDATYAQYLAGTLAWPATGANNTANMDDLWHTAINGRGEFINATDTSKLISAFASVLASIGERLGSSSSVAAAGSRYSAGTLIYQPVYDTTDWSGNIRAFDISNLSTPVADARTKLNAQDYDDRIMISYNNETNVGIPFRFTNMSTSQKALLNLDIVNYLRGDDSLEETDPATAGHIYRDRLFKLGDIVSSEPVYVGPPSRLFPDTLASAPGYASFASTYANRTPVLWVGANDGSLHGFNVDEDIDNDGNRDSPLPSTFLEEVLAYVPSKVYQNLASLSTPAYTHKFYVDGTPTERDVYYGGAWHTVLVGGLNGGGQGIYALDITNPANFTEANASSLVLWEFNDDQDGDLGYTYSQPTVAKMNNGDWMVIFGNGYNNTVNDDANGYCTDVDGMGTPDTSTICPYSTTGDAILYLLNIADGSVARKITTGVGKAQDPAGTDSPNGLSTVEIVDIDGDFTVDYIYAGDLFGNLWKFDVTDSDPTNWGVFLNGSNVPTPLFIATDDSSNRQPITSAPVVSRHPTLDGYLVNFGTGKYLELSDKSNSSLQTFYGIWDRDESSINTILRNHTFAQKIIFENTVQFDPSLNARVTTDDSFNYYFTTAITPALPATPSTDGYLGWRMDLEEPTTANQAYDSVTNPFTRLGERVVYKPQKRGERIVFTTTIPAPSADACAANGESWLMELDAGTGQRLPVTPFDYNGDGIFDANDLVVVGWDVNGDGVVDNNDRLPGSGIQDSAGGTSSRAMILVEADGTEHKIISNSDTSLSDIGESGDDQGLGRRSWQQLIPD